MLMGSNIFRSENLTTTCSTPSTLARGLKNERGQGLIEYLIVVALIAVATIGIMRTVGQAVGSRFASISDAVQGNRKKYAVEAIDENLLRRRDLGDFMNGVGSNGSGGGSGGQ